MSAGKVLLNFRLNAKIVTSEKKIFIFVWFFSHLATQWSISHGWGPALGAQTSFSHIFQLIHVTQKVDAFFQIFRFVNWPNVHLRTENEDLYTHFLILFNWYLSQNLHIVCVHLSTSLFFIFLPLSIISVIWMRPVHSSSACSVGMPNCAFDLSPFYSNIAI